MPGRVIRFPRLATISTRLNPEEPTRRKVSRMALRGAAEKVGSELITIDHKSEGTSAVTDQNA
jgi:hypothetical protein